MPEPWETLKLLSDPTRLRLLSLLNAEELSVAELQEILDMGQSRISSHLALLRSAELVTDRKAGKRSFYSLNKELDAGSRDLLTAATQALASSREFAADRGGLERVIERRRRQSEDYFNAVAGRLGKHYCPGRSWEAVGHLLLNLVPSVVIADLGAGEGVLSSMLAKQAQKVYCIDNAPKMVEFGREIAQRHGLENVEYLLGDIESVPLDDASVDVALLSQALHHAIHPERAIAEAARILKPGGQVLILDLREHSFEKARELYADRWLGFSENTLFGWLKESGFTMIETRLVTREEDEPKFETVLASAVKG